MRKFNMSIGILSIVFAVVSFTNVMILQTFNAAFGNIDKNLISIGCIYMVAMVVAGIMEIVNSGDNLTADKRSAINLFKIIFPIVLYIVAAVPCFVSEAVKNFALFGTISAVFAVMLVVKRYRKMKKGEK